MKRDSLILILAMLTASLYSQSILNPGYGLKSPVTAELVRVDFTGTSTVVWITIMSDINNAYFCIDRNTFLVKPDGTRIRMNEVKGLPYCPKTYRFKKPGEKASFSLAFPATGLLPWFSITEECGGGCLSFYGVVTDEALNTSLREAYRLSDSGESMAAYRIFEELIEKTDSLNLGTEGAIFSNLIMLDRKMGRSESARSWYSKMMTSDAPDLGKYLDNLASQGYKQ